MAMDGPIQAFFILPEKTYFRHCFYHDKLFRWFIETMLRFVQLCSYACVHG